MDDTMWIPRGSYTASLWHSKDFSLQLDGEYFTGISHEFQESHGIPKGLEVYIHNPFALKWERECSKPVWIVRDRRTLQSALCK